MAILPWGLYLFFNLVKSSTEYFPSTHDFKALLLAAFFIVFLTTRCPVHFTKILGSTWQPLHRVWQSPTAGGAALAISQEKAISTAACQRLVLQFQERKSHNRNHATNICALALDEWNGLTIGVSLKTVQGQQSWGLCSTGRAVDAFPKVLPSRQSCSYVFTSWACNGPPPGPPDHPGSPYLHWDLSAQVSVWRRSDGLSHLSSRLPQRLTWGCLEHRNISLLWWLTLSCRHRSPFAEAWWLENCSQCQLLLSFLAVCWDTLASCTDFSNILHCGFPCSAQDILQKAPYKLTQ